VTCPATRSYVERLNALEAAYAGRADFLFIYPNGVNESAESKARFHKDSRFVGPLLDDTGARIAKLVKVDHTCMAIVADKSGKVMFRGGIDDNLLYPNKVVHRWLGTALEQILGDKPVVAPAPGSIFGASVRA